jgi:hypothetical protein
MTGEPRLFRGIGRSSPFLASRSTRALLAVALGLGDGSVSAVPPRAGVGALLARGLGALLGRGAGGA